MNHNKGQSWEDTTLTNRYTWMTLSRNWNQEKKITRYIIGIAVESNKSKHLLINVQITQSVTTCEWKSDTTVQLINLQGYCKASTTLTALLLM